MDIKEKADRLFQGRLPDIVSEAPRILSEIASDPDAMIRLMAATKLLSEKWGCEAQQVNFRAVIIVAEQQLDAEDFAEEMARLREGFRLYNP